MTSKKKLKQAASCVAGGAAVGMGAASYLGGMGLAVGGTAIGIGAAPVVVAGAIVGLAGFGAASIFQK